MHQAADRLLDYLHKPRSFFTKARAAMNDCAITVSVHNDSVYWAAVRKPSSVFLDLATCPSTWFVCLFTVEASSDCGSAGRLPPGQQRPTVLGPLILFACPQVEAEFKQAETAAVLNEERAAQEAELEEEEERLASSVRWIPVFACAAVFEVVVGGAGGRAGGGGAAAVAGQLGRLIWLTVYEAGRHIHPWCSRPCLSPVQCDPVTPAASARMLIAAGGSQAR